MAKSRYTKKILQQVVGLIEKDSYTVAEICGMVGISERSYYNWVNEHADFADAIKRAKDRFDELCVKEAKKSLMKQVKGYDYEEVKTKFINGKDGKPMIAEQTKIKKHFRPDTASIIFTLTNKAPEEFKNRQNIDAKGDFTHQIGFGDFLMMAATVEDDNDEGDVANEVQE